MARPRLWLLGVPALAMLGACGTDTGAREATAAAADTTRIIPVNGDLAEVVFALGFGESVVATDISATYPAEADALPEIGYQRALVAETILTHEPTLVLADALAGPPGVLDELRATGVEVAVIDFPHSLEGPAAKVRAVAEVLGVPERGEDLATTIEAGIDDVVANLPDGEAPRVAALYFRGAGVQRIAGTGTGVGALVEAAGGINVGTELGVEDFAPITEEALVAAAPDVLVVTTSGLESVGGIDGLLAVPAIAGTPAGRDRRILAYDDQLLLGLGPRTPEVLAALATDLHEGDT